MDACGHEQNPWYANLPRKREAAGALFFDDDGNVLLVRPTYADGTWDFPGGVVEADESPYAGACREVEEELGLRRNLGRALVVDWEPRTPGIPLEGVTLVFDGGVLTSDDIASIRLQSEELDAFEFCTPQEAARRLPPPLSRKVAAALAAREAGNLHYLEDGYPVGR